ncbi:hypothetical protein [Gymnodinialimonas ulvae]|uniref:hypothetical protein n=1 Tax=Gymnodinialimonas ulvae TaxID=3126504 RepID=UPI0030B37821
MPSHIRFLLRHAAFGAVIAAAFVGLVLWANIGNLWHLVTHTPQGFFAVGIFWVLCTITFGSVQMGIRIMMLAEKEEDDGGGGTRSPQAVFEPDTIPVRVHPDRADHRNA